MIFKQCNNLNNFVELNIDLEPVAKSIDNLATQTSKSAQEIAYSILQSSTSISSSLTAITNEIERAHKLDEYYSLLKRIEEYEKQLFTEGLLQKAYEEMSLMYIPLISTDERAIFLTLKYFEDMPMLKSIISTYKVCPTQIIKFCIISGKYTVKVLGGLHSPANNVLALHYSHGDNSIYISSAKYDYDNNSHSFLPQSVENANLFLETCINSINTENITNNLSQIIKFKHFINKINLDITIDNLRNLYLALLNAVRQYAYKLPLSK